MEKRTEHGYHRRNHRVPAEYVVMKVWKHMIRINKITELERS